MPVAFSPKSGGGILSLNQTVSGQDLLTQIFVHVDILKIQNTSLLNVACLMNKGKSSLTK